MAEAPVWGAVGDPFKGSCIRGVDFEENLENGYSDGAAEVWERGRGLLLAAVISKSVSSSSRISEETLADKGEPLIL